MNLSAAIFKLRKTVMMTLAAKRGNSVAWLDWLDRLDRLNWMGHDKRRFIDGSTRLISCPSGFD